MTPMDYAIKSFESAANNYCKDLEVMPEEQLLQSAGGAARTPVDFTYELVLIHDKVLARFKGQEPAKSPLDDDGWCQAPEDWRSKSALIQKMRTSCDDLAAAAKAMSPEESYKIYGDAKSPAYAQMNFLALHAMYHAAQLNFIQSMTGDLEVHW